jgi:hypothetical protein
MTAERIAVDADGNFVECLCGNQDHRLGFHPVVVSDQEGVIEVEADLVGPWLDLWVCGNCGRIIRADGEVVGNTDLDAVRWLP